MTGQHADEGIPALVRAAQALAERMQFPLSSMPATGRLLHLLTGLLPHGRIGETGAGRGVGAAWIVSALAPAARFVTVEHDRERAAAVHHLLQPYGNAAVLHGDWTELLAHGPFDLLFLDGGGRLKARMEGDTRAPPDEAGIARALAALCPGGLLLLDDLTPVEDWPPGWRSRPDLTRERWPIRGCRRWRRGSIRAAGRPARCCWRANSAKPLARKPPFADTVERMRPPGATHPHPAVRTAEHEPGDQRQSARCDRAFPRPYPPAARHRAEPVRLLAVGR